MRWTLLNALGGLIWLAGLEFAKGASLPIGTIAMTDDHRLLSGAVVGLAGLCVLLWTNLRSSA